MICARYLSVINNSCRSAGGAACLALQLGVQSIHFVTSSVFPPCIGQGVTPSSKILYADSTSAREYRGQKREKITHTLFVPSPQIFPTSGAPISGLGADIRMLSPPSARGSCVLKIRSDARFLYEHSKALIGAGEVVASFSQKRWSYLGACCPGPSARSVQRVCLLTSDVISLHNSM